MRPGPPPAPVAAPNLPPSRCSHRSSSILPQELQGNFSSRSRGLPLGEPAERRVLEGQARAAEGCGGVGCAGASSRPTCLIYLQRLWRPPPLFHSAFPAPFPAASEAFSCPPPLYPLAGVGGAARKILWPRSFSRAWGLREHTYRQTGHFPDLFLPLGKAPVACCACCLENAKAEGAVAQVKPVSFSPLLSSVLQCFRVVEILDIYSQLRA